MKIHATKQPRRHLQTRFLARVNPTDKPAEIPKSPLPAASSKTMFSQDEKQIVALASLNMKNQKITNVKSGMDDSDAVNVASMKMYVSNAMRTASPVNDRDMINKAHLDSRLLNMESNVGKVVDNKVDELRTSLQRVHVSDYTRHDDQLKQFEESLKQLDTTNNSAVAAIEQQLRLLKNIMVLRQTTLHSAVNGQFVHGIFFKDVKITSIMANGLKSNVKLQGIYTQGPNTIKRELKPKAKSPNEYEFSLDIGNDSKFVTFETSPMVGDISITIFYEQKSPSTPSQ